MLLSFSRKRTADFPSAQIGSSIKNGRRHRKPRRFFYLCVDRRTQPPAGIQNDGFMKRYVLIALIGIACLRPTTAPAQSELQDPSQTARQREMPGSRLRSYDSRELALREDDAHSLYIQQLDGEWKVKTYASPVELDSTVAMPSVDVSQWAVTRVPEQRSNGAWAAVYRTDFKLPFKWIDREVFVRLDAVSRAYYVYVNGRPAGYFADSKTPAYFDVTRYCVDGRNTLCVVAYANPVSTALENQNSEQGTRIAGSVTVMAQPKVRIRDWVVDTRWAPDGNGLFSFGAVVKSHLLNPKRVTVYYELIAPDSTVVSHGKRDARFELRAEDTVRFFANLPGIQSWSHESPKLYTVALKLQHEGRFTEYTKVRVGFRDVSFDSTGLRINGRPVELRAVDYECPSDEQAIRRDFVRFRQQGINCVRVALYPQSDRFYELADSYGIYVCDRANIDSHLSGFSLEKGGSPANDPAWERAYTDRVMNMYRTSQNHPSVVMFSLGKQGGQGYAAYEAYLKLKAAEKDRPVIYEGAGAEWNTDFVVGRPDGRNASDRRFSLTFASPGSHEGRTAPENATSIAPGSAPGSAPGDVTIHNGFRVANLKNFRVGYQIVAGAKRVVAEGICSADIPPRETATVRVPLDGVKPGKYRIKVTVSRCDEPDLAPQGEILAEAFVPLIVPKASKQ
jgi:beta-galactosidase/beta-glucuronidase